MFGTVVGKRCVCVMLLLFGMAMSPVGSAELVENAAAVRSVEREIEALKRDMVGAATHDARRSLLDRAHATHEKAVALQAALAAPVDRIEQRIALLGADAGRSPDAAVRRQHAELGGALAAHIALRQRTALAEVEALQSLNTLTQEQARALGSELFARTPSPLSPALWTAGAASLQRDFAREQSAASATPVSNRPRSLVALALIAWAAATWLLIGPGTRTLDRVGMKLADALAGREARFALSLFAVWTVIVGVLLPTISAWILLMIVHWAALPAPLIEFLASVIVAVVIGFFVRAAALAALQPENRMWRLWKVGSGAAALGARAGNTLASAIVVVIAVEAAIDRFALAAATQVFVHSALAVVTIAQIGYALFVLGTMHRLDGASENAEERAGRARLTFYVGLGWLGLAGLAGAGLLGYVAFANRVAQWAIWAWSVFLITYILMVFVDGLCRRLATARTRRRQATPANPALRQAAVLLSAICRLLLLALACGALLVPFGAGFTSILELLGPLAKGFEMGGITISAAAVLRAVVAFAVVVALVRFFRAWISDSYLPTTSLQPDARDSIDKILRYAGIVLAALWGLTAFGVGMEKVAILASALSVGIGFGLQAITQNFVSGLILLVERPVKIGDWVKLNEVEGDIRRINVRSTEIRVADHSTVIVPNSELITKVVQNMTRGNALGRVQFLLSVPLDADLDEAIEVIEAALSADDEVLETPAPAVFVDRVESGMAVLNCFAHVRSSRAAYGARSRILRATLRAMKDGKITVSLPAQRFVAAPAIPA